MRASDEQAPPVSGSAQQRLRWFVRPRFAVPVVLVLLLTAIAISQHGAASKTVARATPAVSVRSVLAVSRDVPLVLDTTGTVTALDTVEVRPQITSRVIRVHVHEGQFVHAGEPLFTLDGRTDEVALQRAQADLLKDQATQADNQRQLQRSRELLAQNFVSQSAVDTDLSKSQSQEATLASDRAAIAAARVALSYDTIVAPTTGRIGAINVYAGSLVQPGMNAPMVTVTQIDPIAVSFALPQRNLTDAIDSMHAGSTNVQVHTEGKPARSARIVFVDNTVDANTGTVRVKAQLDNADQVLWPGAFVDVHFTARTLHNAIVVPQAALIQGNNGSLLYTVAADGTAQGKQVQLMASAGDEAVVSGVSAGERVIVDGKQNVHTGSAVREGGTTTAAPSAAPARLGKKASRTKA